VVDVTPESVTVEDESPVPVAESVALSESTASDESLLCAASFAAVPESMTVVPPELLLLEQPAAAVPIPTTTRT
jgi:hypothetical protein